MTRFLISLPDAVELVALAMDAPPAGRIFVRKSPAATVAQMARVIGPGHPTEVIGIRPGEKLHEELFGLGESEQPTAAKRIQRAVRGVPLDPDWVESTLNSLEHLVLAGDEANLAERVVGMITAPGGDAATVVYDE